MATIWKYVLEETDHQFITMPTRARVLSVAVQKGQICLWALVDPDRELVDYLVEIYSTGQPGIEIADDMKYCGTVLLYGKSIVLHVFVRQPDFPIPV
jgi:hypothetical protein